MDEQYAKIMDRINQDNCFLQSSHMKVTRVDSGEAVVQMQITPETLNIYGLVHGGAIFSLADTAAGAASFTSGRESVTLSSSMNFLASARHGWLYARAISAHTGGSTGVYQVRVTDQNERLIAVGTFTMYFMRS